MKEELYDLVFTGELVPGSDLVQTKKNLANLFKMSPDKVEMLFSGRKVVLKRQLNPDAANTYRVAIKKAGARVDLVQCQAVDQSPADKAKPPEAPRKASFTVGEPQAAAQAQDALRTQNLSDANDANEADVNQTSKAAKSGDLPNNNDVSKKGEAYSLKAQGGNLVESSELEHAASVEVDTGHISLRETSGNLVDEGEIVHADELDIEIPDIELSSLDEDLLKPDERKQPERSALMDVEFDLAEAGARLSEPKQETAVEPNTDHLSLL